MRPTRSAELLAAARRARCRLARRSRRRQRRGRRTACAAAWSCRRRWRRAPPTTRRRAPSSVSPLSTAPLGQEHARIGKTHQAAARRRAARRRAGRARPCAARPSSQRRERRAGAPVRRRRCARAPARSAWRGADRHVLEAVGRQHPRQPARTAPARRGRGGDWRRRARSAPHRAAAAAGARPAPARAGSPAARPYDSDRNGRCASCRAAQRAQYARAPGAGPQRSAHPGGCRCGTSPFRPRAARSYPSHALVLVLALRTEIGDLLLEARGTRGRSRPSR